MCHGGHPGSRELRQNSANTRGYPAVTAGVRPQRCQPRSDLPVHLCNPARGARQARIFLQPRCTKRRSSTTGRTRGGPIVGILPIAKSGADAVERWGRGTAKGTGSSGRMSPPYAATLVERMNG